MLFFEMNSDMVRDCSVMFGMSYRLQTMFWTRQSLCSCQFFGKITRFAWDM